MYPFYPYYLTRWTIGNLYHYTYGGTVLLTERILGQINTHTPTHNSLHPKIYNFSALQEYKNETDTRNFHFSTATKDAPNVEPEPYNTNPKRWAQIVQQRKSSAAVLLRTAHIRGKYVLFWNSLF